MQIDKAIEILEYHITEPGYDRLSPKVDAIKLGIEALKRIKKSRGEATRYYIGYLPGEE